MRELLVQKIVEAIDTPFPRLTPRDAFRPQVGGRKAYAVIGMRRAGKTTYLWQVMAEAHRAGTPREALLYFNCEDDRLAPLTVADLSAALEEYYRLYPTVREQGVILCWDEIQVVSGWERFVRRLLDTEQAQIYLSGSSARLLSREIATEMRGRALEVRIYPFSFREYLRHRALEPQKAWEYLTKSERSTLEHALEQYLAEGGFPEAVGSEARSRIELLRSYVDTALLRDVVERYQVSHPVALRWLTRQLLGNAGSPFSVHKFHNDLKAQGFAIGKDRVYEYLSHLEDAFLVRTVALATQSERKRMTNPRKAYPIDPALIALHAPTPQRNIGHALETVVYLELERRGAEVGYVRIQNGYEVDFYARYPSGETALIQVCADWSDAATRERELRALEQAQPLYPEARSIILTLNPPLRTPYPVMSACRWLLDVSA
ncbi:MAG: ATP-binding protein [Fimbriimonadales bacterium]|nr:ATP-binding protein [Fimbriimonadales bacterium]MDW8293671.1 ATP-binding protein [Anaerolineae bacterium]